MLHLRSALQPHTLLDHVRFKRGFKQVRASRGLPLRLMAAEYERILKRRLKKVGGSQDDPALGQLLAVFK